MLEREKLLVSMSSVDDWMELIKWGELAFKANLVHYPSKKNSTISLKYYDEEKHFCQIKQDFIYNYKEAIINLGLIKFLEEKV